jgi:hypothetical protein
MPIPYNTQNIQSFISSEDNRYFSSQYKSNSCLRADSRVNQSEPDRIEYDDVPFIDYDAQTSRRIGVEDDLEIIVFDNKAAENKGVENKGVENKGVENEVVHHHQPNQQVYSYNNCDTYPYQQGYNPVPIVEFNASIVNRSMRMPVFVSGFPSTRTQVFISGFPSLRNVL